MVDDSACLKSLARVLVAKVRLLDSIHRIGGDEFAIVLSGCSASAALVVRENTEWRLSLPRCENPRRVIRISSDRHLGSGLSSASKRWGRAAGPEADEKCRRPRRGMASR